MLNPRILKKSVFTGNISFHKSAISRSEMLLDRCLIKVESIVVSTLAKVRHFFGIGFWIDLGQMLDSIVGTLGYSLAPSGPQVAHKIRQVAPT